MIENMNNIKRVISSLVLIFLILITSSVAMASEVSGKEYLINSKTQLIKELKYLSDDNNTNKTLQTKKYEQILKNTDPTVIEEYKVYSKEQVVNAMNELSKKGGVKFDKNNRDTITQENGIELEDGTVVTLTEKVGNIDSSTIAFNRLMGIASITGTHNYGNRFYSFQYQVAKTPYPDTKLGLSTSFNASKSSGLTATSTSTAGCSSFYPVQITKKTSKVTDSTAKTVGTDINGQGDYTYKAIVEGREIWAYDVTLISTVRLDALNSTTYKSTASNTVIK